MRILVVAIAIIALAAVSFYAVQALPPQIEADLKHRSAAALANANLQFANVSVKGRVVTLSGEAPGPMAKEDAVKIVQNVWGVASVTDALKVSSAAQPAAPQAVIASASPPAEPAPALTLAAPEPEPQPVAPPATEEPPPSTAPSTALPAVDGMIDPSLAPPTEATPAEPAPAEPPPTTEQATAPAVPPAPTTDTQTANAQFSSAPPAAAPAPAETPVVPTPTPPAPNVTTPAPPPAAVATTPVPAPPPAAVATTPVPAPPPAAVATTPVPTPPPAVVASTQTPTPTPPPAAVATPTPTPAPATPPPPAVIAQGATAGLTTSVQMATPPAAPEPPSYRLEAQVDGRRIELQGLVSTPSAQRALVAHTRRQLYRAQVVDTLQVAHAKPDRDWLRVARIGLTQLAHLDNGSLSIDGHKVSMSGRPRSENDRAHVLAALNGLPAGYTSTVMLERKPDATPPVSAPAPAVVVAEARPPAPPPAPRVVAPRAPRAAVEVRREERRPRYARPRYRTGSRVFVSSHGLSSDCRRRFGDVLPRVAVVFDSGSSRVRSNAVSGLDELAHVARSCPRARISLTGHSDTYEASAAALQLSRARAYAVRQALEARGVAGSNISVAARGGLSPAFSNATADGRDNNRRVEFAVW